MNIMKDCINQHQKSILEKSKNKDELSKYVFKTSMDHHMISKFIGRGGSNIHHIIDDIQEKDRFDIILANPPFGGGERKEVQQNFPIKTGETAFLFLLKIKLNYTKYHRPAI